MIAENTPVAVILGSALFKFNAPHVSKYCTTIIVLMMKQPTVDMTLIYTRIVERYATFFPRPESRLRFFNSTIAKQVARQRKVETSLKKLSFIQNTPIYRWVMESMLHRAIIEELTELLPASKAQRKEMLREAPIPFGAKVWFLIYRMRYMFYGLGLATVALLIFGLYSLALFSGNRLNQYLAQKYGRGNGQAGVLATTVAKYLPGYDPDKVWFVKKEGNFELYSNGARILTDYETDNHARNYILYSKDDPLQELNLPVQHNIVGLIFHTTESELVDFKPDKNSDLLRHSQGLLGWVKKEKSYNYVIDRVGQIHRIVRDEQAADHAGHSIWSDEKYTYVSLNESFLGIAFESSIEADVTDQLTEAQVVAGRQITAILRSKYNISDTNCTTHGLVSISPRNMLIGHHTDWAHNFPFAAMGLSDKYSVLPASVSLYGCGWEDEVLTKMGGNLWAAVKPAETAFLARAEKLDLSPDELRKQMKERYNAQLEVSRKLRDSSPNENYQATNKEEKAESQAGSR